MSKESEKVVTHIKPDWLKIRIKSEEQYAKVSRIVNKHGLHTICSSGMCPNKADCWNRLTATFMILGDICTRGCRFCATKTGKGLMVDKNEPEQLANSIALMGLKHAVITSVTRDDLPDEGAEHWAEVVRAVRAKNSETTIELLIPDMHAQRALIDIIIESRPDIIGHNMETVERLSPLVRSGANYKTSLETIKYIGERGIISKSGIMVGLGENSDEVLKTMDDLAQVGCRILTIGQYLRPTLEHWEVAEYVRPETFEWYREQALERGFSYVASAPLVRSSYMAERALEVCGVINPATR